MRVRSSGILICLLIGLSAVGCSTPSQSGAALPGPTVAPTAAASPTPSFELTREVVLTLIRPRMERSVDALFPPRPSGFQTGDYQTMVNQKMIDCRPGFGVWENCKPGPNGKEFRLNEEGRLFVVIGRKTPEVTGVSRTDQTSGVAQVTVTFQRSAGYAFFEKWRTAFTEYNINNEQHTVHLRLYDNGWRIDSIE